MIKNGDSVDDMSDCDHTPLLAFGKVIKYERAQKYRCSKCGIAYPIDNQEKEFWNSVC